MKLLIGGAPPKKFHLEEFASSLENLGIKTKLVIDTDIYTGFPSRKITKWFETKKKFLDLISEFKPDAILVDRQNTLFDVAAVESKIPVFVHLRGDYWSEIKWARETIYKGFLKKKILKIKEKRADKCFNDSKIIFPICNYLKKIVQNHYPKKPVEVIYQGIDPKRWYKSEGMKLKHPCVGLVQSANIWGKTQEMLVLEKILESMPEVTFYWAGDGPYANKVLPTLKKFDNFHMVRSITIPK